MVNQREDSSRFTCTAHGCPTPRRKRLRLFVVGVGKTHLLEFTMICNFSLLNFIGKREDVGMIR